MENFDWMQIKFFGVPIDRVLLTACLILAAFAIISYLIRLLRKQLLRHRNKLHISYASIILVSRLLRIVLWIATLFLALNLWGVSVSGLWTALLSVATIIGVGFLAVWTMVSNVTANLFLTIWRPFQLGTSVEILPEHLKGKVVETNLMFSVLREDSGDTVYVPNNMFFQKMFRVCGEADPRLFESILDEEKKDYLG